MTLKKFAILFLSIIVSLVYLPGHLFVNPSSGIDPSWQVALNLALKNHLVFGRDFIFTYGPLGILQTRLSIGVSPYVYVLLDVFVCANIAYIFYKTLTSGNFWLTLKIIFIFLLVSHHDSSLYLLAFVVFLIFQFIDTRQRWILIDLLLVASVAFFVKLSTGLIPVVFLAVFVWYALSQGILKRWEALVFVGGYLILIVTLSSIFPTDLMAYIRNGLSIINGYSEAMYLNRTDYFSLVDLEKGVLIMLFLIVPFLLFFKKIWADKRTLLLYFMIFSSMYTLFKVAFTRIHDGQFFTYAILFSGILVFFTRVEQRQILVYTLLPVVLISLLYAFRTKDLVHHVRMYTTFSPWNILKTYKAQFDYYQGDNPTYMSGNYEIPPDLPDLLADRTVDIMPWDIGLITNHHFNYLPRPIPQTYSAYTGRLDEINATAIKEKAPEIVLVSPVSIETRYHIFDESKTKLELLSRYEVQKASSDWWNYIMLKKLSKPVDYILKPLDQKEHFFGDTISLRTTDNIQIAYPEIEYSLLGSLYKFFFWAPDLSITMTLQDNSEHTFKCVRTIANAGVVINKYVPSTGVEEMELFLDQYGRCNSNVKIVRFTSQSPWAFKKTFDMRVDEVVFSRRKNDINPKYQPGVITEASGKTPVKANLEALTIETNRIDLAGWGFANDSLYNKLAPHIVLESEGKFLVFPVAGRASRPDVKSTIGEHSPDSSGFRAVILRDLLEKKPYNLGLGFLSGGKLVAHAMLGHQIDNREHASIPKTSFNKFTLRKNDIEEDLRFSIEKLDVERLTLCISGWAATKIKTTKTSQPVKIVLRNNNGDIFAAPTNRSLRPDVADHFKDENIDSVGFSATVSLDSIPSDQYDIGLYVFDPGSKIGTYHFFKRIYIGESSYATAIPFKDKFNTVTLNTGIDKFVDDRRTLRIDGWAAIPDRDAVDTEIFVLLESEDDELLVAPVISVKRPDVTSYYKGKFNLDDSGFTCTINKESLANGRYEIGILIKSGKESFVSFIDQQIIK